MAIRRCDCARATSSWPAATHSWKRRSRRPEPPTCSCGATRRCSSHRRRRSAAAGPTRCTRSCARCLDGRLGCIVSPIGSRMSRPARSSGRRSGRLHGRRAGGPTRAGLLRPRDGAAPRRFFGPAAPRIELPDLRSVLYHEDGAGRVRPRHEHRLQHRDWGAEGKHPRGIHTGQRCTVRPGRTCSVW